MYDEIREKFGKTFPKMSDLNKLRNDTSVIRPVLDMK
jgi:hypothetical protein